ncbi:FKBP-type peptidyl-prolyl cis-trans isomerase [Hyperthermus butylicus]|uniref:Peptidyl-prolyl cis-trans isomerase n=1 Tax=Hyperthermus butylicus (strain DSM 5456 / JCM 9403 / PLM1-5) TaxID=415426 RepID=A2BN17_HYPBU|nr:peptidylprolyl isomerase [Hyperthermus butylicus]ABM81378.1 putative FKBP-type peptidyl-prolyl cis-trans isomerase [Hyperthermus butylicus DSM 5456]
MALPDGAFVLVEYTLRVKETGEVIDTTSEEEARKAGVYDPKERYGPRLVIIGEGRLIPGLEKTIKELSPGEEKEVEIPPSEAFGERKPENIKIMPRNVFIRSGVVPEPGKIVEINGMLAVIRSVTGGRVVVDFNHPLAGKTILARVKLIKLIEDVGEKLLHLVLRRLPPIIGEEDVKVDYDAKKKYAKIMFNEKILQIADMQAAKRLVVGEIRKYLANAVSELEFSEHIRIAGEGEKKQTETEAGKAEDKSGEQAKTEGG